VKGKIKYMAPEQASARPVDRRNDLFAVGVMLWEGRAPATDRVEVRGAGASRDAEAPW
jgi:hypothetical protein